MFDFPSGSLTVGQIVTGPNGIQYQWDGTKWTAAVLNTGNFLPLVGGTLTGPMTITPTAAGNSTINLNDAAGNSRQLNFETAGSMRWQINAGSLAESGSNAGSNLYINSYADTGATIGTPLSINRASLASTFGGNVNINAQILKIGAPSAYPAVILNKAASGSACQLIGQTNGIYRWDMALGHAGAESGGTNYGSDFTIDRYDDSGNSLGTAFSIWRSNGQVTVYNSLTVNSNFNCGGQVNITGNTYTGQVHIAAGGGNTTSGYGVWLYNDNSNFYILLTNNNDAQGGWNGLRPFYINLSSGGVSMNQGVSIANGLTANNIVTQYGIVYSGYAGNVISFQWTGSCQLFVDGNNNGTLITSSNWGSYIPNANNNPAGCVLRSGDTMTGSLTVNGTFSCGSTVSSTGYHTRQGTGGGFGNNNFNFWWGGSAMQMWVDSTNAGNVSVVSDYRIKKDVEPLDSTWERTRALRPIRYTLKDFTPPGEKRLPDEPPMIVGDDIERWGFIAHELQEALIMDAATGVKDQKDCIQSPNPWTVIATLTRTLQEAMERIESLELAAGKRQWVS